MSKVFFHKYKPTRRIGSGSFGEIYEVKNTSTGELFAIKLVTF